MNELNYASREASQRLVDAGIALETDYVWYLQPDGHWRIAPKHDIGNLWRVLSADVLPAPSMAEVWRELPDFRTLGDHRIVDFYLDKSGEKSYAGYKDASEITIEKSSTNPTDALIDLLIWVKGGKGCILR